MFEPSGHIIWLTLNSNICTMKRLEISLLALDGALVHCRVGLITSCCSGNEPVLLPKKTAGRVD